MTTGQILRFVLALCFMTTILTFRKDLDRASASCTGTSQAAA
jgi:hypothetical protein